ncbi:MAG: hypothetical protein JWO06_3338 [Bacteroidota bacterium]|nr:hypothetical protein [Bacteroidota bacterium]
MIYRLQKSGEDWILRHPDKTFPLLTHNKEALISLIQDYFKKRKEKATLDILDDWDRPEGRKEFDPFV